MSGFGTSDLNKSDVMLVDMPVLIGCPALKSFPIKNTGNLFWLSLSYGFVEPARSTFIPVKVKIPNLGTQTPFPFLSCLAIYWPNASQMASAPPSISLLVPLTESALYLSKPLLLVAGSPL